METNETRSSTLLAKKDAFRENVVFHDDIVLDNLYCIEPSSDGWMFLGPIVDKQYTPERIQIHVAEVVDPGLTVTDYRSKTIWIDLNNGARMYKVTTDDFPQYYL